MINIAYYYNNDTELENIKSVIETHYKSHKINFKSYSYYSITELMHFCNTRVPDILLFNKCNLASLKNTILYFKKINSELISIITDDTILDKKENIYTYNSKYLPLEPIYIVSNQNKKQLLHYANLAYKSIVSDDEFFEYYKRPEYTQIPINDIIYFQSEGRKINLVCSDTSCYDNDSFYQKLDDLFEDLKSKSCKFLRVHKSTLVNQKYISHFDRFNVKLINGEILKISKPEYYHELKKMTLNSVI